MEGINLTKIYSKHICKYHNVSPCTTYYILIKWKEVQFYQQNTLLPQAFQGQPNSRYQASNTLSFFMPASLTQPDFLEFWARISETGSNPFPWKWSKLCASNPSGYKDLGKWEVLLKNLIREADTWLLPSLYPFRDNSHDYKSTQVP
jgi:hypothetical protein